MTIDALMKNFIHYGDLQPIKDKLLEQEAQLQIAEELVEHILTSGAMNPELGMAEAFRAVGKGKR